MGVIIPCNKLFFFVTFNIHFKNLEERKAILPVLLRSKRNVIRNNINRDEVYVEQSTLNNIKVNNIHHLN